MKIKNKIGVVLLGLTSIQAISQDNKKNIEINKLNEVEITATSQSDKTLLKQAASISKLETKEIQRGTGLFFDDAVNTNIPGMFMQRRTVSAGQTFNIRGYGNGARGTNGTNSNFDSQGVKVYLNNIPVTDAGRNYFNG
ncbi:Plug domain-containing protein [Flavobacterium covae]|nr:Plug domain-containing protein [Flavobacterium covae]QYS90264.1 Plug domain-containing protein [Flavobacterium covae]